MMKKMVIGAGVSTLAAALIFSPLAGFIKKAIATPDKVEKLEVRTDEKLNRLEVQQQKINDYVEQKIDQESFDEKQKKKAPKNYKWSVEDQEYVKIKK